MSTNLRNVISFCFVEIEASEKCEYNSETQRSTNSTEMVKSKNNANSNYIVVRSGYVKKERSTLLLVVAVAAAAAKLRFCSKVGDLKCGIT